MVRRSLCCCAKWLSGAGFAGAMFLSPAAGYGVQSSYHRLLPVTMTVTSVGISMSIARSADGDATGSSNGVTISALSSAPYLLFFDQGLSASGSQRNLRDGAGIAAYRLCGDPACAKVWATDGDPATGILVTPGSATTTLPFTVVRAANAADEGSHSDVVMLIMYF
jgi:hypothetical protein